VSQQDPDEPEGSAQKAEELMDAAAYSPEGGSRLWRLEWAQAFKRLSDLGKRRDGPPDHN